MTTITVDNLNSETHNVVTYSLLLISGEVHSCPTHDVILVTNQTKCSPAQKLTRHERTGSWPAQNSTSKSKGGEVGVVELPRGLSQSWPTDSDSCELYVGDV